MKIGVMGAGAIGCYVGGRLLASGADVLLVGRASIADEIARCGLRLTDYRGTDVVVGPDRVRVATAPAELAACDVVLVTVKGGDTAATAAALAPVLSPACVVVSLQNGVHNADILRAALGHDRVRAGVVPFNVLRKGDGAFHQGTSGTIAIERVVAVGGDGGHGHVADGLVDGLVGALARARLKARVRADIERVQWGKLLVNLNNAVNALAGVPIKEMLADPGYRRVMAACLREAVVVLRAAGIRPRLDPPVPPALVPRILALPDALFRPALRVLVRVDPQARSSMSDDLVRGRKTEVDALNGEIVRVAAAAGVPAPVNAAVVALVHAAEGHGLARTPSAELCARVGV